MTTDGVAWVSTSGPIIVRRSGSATGTDPPVSIHATISVVRPDGEELIGPDALGPHAVNRGPGPDVECRGDDEAPAGEGDRTPAGYDRELNVLVSVAPAWGPVATTASIWAAATSGSTAEHVSIGRSETLYRRSTDRDRGAGRSKKDDPLATGERAEQHGWLGQLHGIVDDEEQGTGRKGGVGGGADVDVDVDGCDGNVDQRWRRRTPPAGPRGPTRHVPPHCTPRRSTTTSRCPLCDR